MDTTMQDDLKAHLMATNEEFCRLANQHCEYKKKLEELHARPHLTDQEQIEEVRLKKIKLHVKDQMEEIMSRYRAQHV